MTRVRITHFWYDGPQIAAEVELSDGEWVGCNISRYSDELYELLAEADTSDWPEGIYVLDKGRLTTEATAIAFKPREETAS